MHITQASQHLEPIIGEGYYSGESEGSGNTPPPVDTEPDTALESSVVDSITVDSDSLKSAPAPVHFDSNSRDHVPETENTTTAPADIITSVPSSGRALGDQSAVPAPTSRDPRSSNPIKRPSLVAILHEELWLLGTPSVDGIRRHVQGLRRQTRLLENKLHGEGDIFTGFSTPQAVSYTHLTLPTKA